MFSSPQHRISVFSRRLAFGFVALRVIAASWFQAAPRSLLKDAWRVSRSLPARYEADALPVFLASLGPQAPDLTDFDPQKTVAIVDAVARLDRRSPFGLCLRRSLLRYYYLRRAGVPLGITFAVRFRQPHEGEGIAGHAWNTLDGQPWHEREEDYRGFTVIYEWRG